MTRVMNEPCRSFFGRGAAAALAVSAAATLAWNAGAAWGLRYEVSKDGVDWSTSVAANPGETVQFRMLSYFDIGTKITTADGTGNARALNRFTGQQQVLGMLAGIRSPTPRSGCSRAGARRLAR